MMVRGGIPSNSVIEIKKHRLDDHSKVEVIATRGIDGGRARVSCFDIQINIVVQILLMRKCIKFFQRRKEQWKGN